MKQFLDAETQSALQKVKADPDRLSFHLMPAVGWLNDPNGLYEKDGVYHIFYQYAPQSADGSSLKGWGHYSTRDFVHYMQEKPMLFPDSEMDSAGAYSGSAFVDKDKVHFFYTGNGKLPGDYDYINEGRLHWVNHFTTEDGKTFSAKETLMKNEDYPANLSCHVRDPKVIQDGDTYYMVLGSRTRNSKGQVNVFESENLHDWKPVSVITPQTPFGYMWECPDIFDLDGRRLLICCPQGIEQEGYKFENVYQNGYFFIDSPLSSDQKTGQFYELDNGFDFYAPQTFEDENGRRILIGWMGIPDADYTNPTAEKAGWQHALTLPRVLHLKGSRVCQYPVEELEALRTSETPVDLKKEIPMDLLGSTFELQLDVEDKPFCLTLRKDVRLSWNGSLFVLDMGNSGSGRTQRHLEISSLQRISVFSDTSSLEIFLNHGEYAFTTRIYDDQKNLQLKADRDMSGVLYTLKGFEIVWDYVPNAQQNS